MCNKHPSKISQHSISHWTTLSRIHHPLYIIFPNPCTGHWSTVRSNVFCELSSFTTQEVLRDKQQPSITRSLEDSINHKEAENKKSFSENPFLEVNISLVPWPIGLVDIIVLCLAERGVKGNKSLGKKKLLIWRNYESLLYDVSNLDVKSLKTSTGWTFDFILFSTGIQYCFLQNEWYMDLP